jgi:hypothetical protein
LLSKGSAVIERRRYPRNSVSWPVRLWLTQDCFFVGRAVDAGAKGVRITLPNRRTQAILHPGRQCRIEVDAEAFGAFSGVAVVRHAGDVGIGLELREPVPTELISRPPSEGRVSAESLESQHRGKDGGEPPESAQALTALAAVVIWAARGMSDVVRASIGEGLEDSALAAVRHALAQDWTAVGRTLTALVTLVRYVARLEELSREECEVIQSALAAARDSADVPA